MGILKKCGEEYWIRLSALFGGFLGGLNHSQFFLLLVYVTVLVLDSIFDYSLDDLFSGDGATRVYGYEFAERLWNLIWIRDVGWNVRLSMAHDGDVQLID